MVAFNPVDLAIVSLSVPQLRPICARHACTVKVTLSNVKATTVFVVLPCPKLGMVSSRMQVAQFIGQLSVISQRAGYPRDTFHIDANGMALASTQCLPK